MIKKHSKNVLNLSKQTYLFITNHFGGLRPVSVKLLRDFGATTLNSTDLCPKFRPLAAHPMITSNLEVGIADVKKVKE